MEDPSAHHALCLCSASVCVYVNKHGNCGPHLDRKQMQRLPDHFGPGPVNAVLQQVVQSCIDCAYQPKVLLSALQNDSGGGEPVKGKSPDKALYIRSKKQTNLMALTWKGCFFFVFKVRTDGGIRVIKLPSASSASFVLRFLESMCRHLQCDNLFSSQPFSHYTAYDRNKSGKWCIRLLLASQTTAPFIGEEVWSHDYISSVECICIICIIFFWLLVKEEALDAPSLARASKRSLSGVSPPYAAPLSPKHLRAEAHPSEGTAHISNAMCKAKPWLTFKTIILTKIVTCS